VGIVHCHGLLDCHGLFRKCLVMFVPSLSRMNVLAIGEMDWGMAGETHGVERAD
jgi:hypothetical protein